MSEKTHASLVWRTAKRKVIDLVPYDKNPRKLSKEQEKNLKKSLEKFNLVEIPAIDLDNKVIAGHQRLHVLKLLGRGDEEIDVRIPNRKLTEEEYKKYMIASNAISGEWEYDLLKDFDPEFLLDAGFDEKLLENIWDDVTEDKEDFDEKQELEKVKETDIKQGDLILLGNNRLVCGNSNERKVLEKLFKKDKADLIISDPVYNLDIDYNKGLGGKRDFGGNVNDKRTEEEYIDFLRTNIKNSISFTKPDCHFFYWNTEEQTWILQTLYKELGIQNKRVCLWIKNQANPTPQVAFSKVYESCIYGIKGKPYLNQNKNEFNEVLNYNSGNGNELLDNINIWTSKRVNGKEMNHATQKPVDLYYKPILRCSKVGDIILDTFGGSGSTLIAGEKLKRKVYMVELEPIFCQLIVNRYEKLTGNKAKIIKDK